jgi:hypothetical protein
MNDTLHEGYNNRGVILHEMRRLSEGIRDLTRALELKPEFDEARWNRSMLLLTVGDFEQGWQDYEARFKATVSIVCNREYDKPRWTGVEPLEGKTILIVGEQGLGDTLQFCRYIPLVAKLGAKVIFESQVQLVEIMKRLEGVSEVVPTYFPGGTMPEYDYYCALISLPLAFKTRLENIPASVPYISADPIKVRQWGNVLGPKTKPRVGLVWSGGISNDQQDSTATKRRRNMSLFQLAGLRAADVEFISLQKGQPAEGELAEAKRVGWDGPDILDYTDRLKDFSDTAALIENLDLVIAVDTSTPHMAAALGKPTWIMSRFDACWRWLDQREDNPWYPTVRLFNQRKPLEWDQVIEEVIIALKKYATTVS